MGDILTEKNLKAYIGYSIERKRKEIEGSPLIKALLVQIDDTFEILKEELCRLGINTDHYAVQTPEISLFDGTFSRGIIGSSYWEHYEKRLRGKVIARHIDFGKGGDKDAYN